MTTRRGFLESLPAASAAIATPTLGRYDRSETGQQAPSFTFDVTQFGARGDGTTDDRAAIQATLEAAKSAGGGIVFFPKGQYAIRGPLEMGNLQDISFLGTGSASALLAPPVTNFVMFGISGPIRVRIAHLRFVGVDAASSVAVRVTDATDFEVAHCSMLHGNSGIRIFSSPGATPSRNIRLINNTIERLTGSGAGIIIGAGCHDIIISGNIVDIVGEEGISLDGSIPGATPQPERATIVANRVSRTGRSGIGIYRASNTTVANNVVEGTELGFAGISVSTDSTDILCKQIAVSGNVVDGAGGDGIRIRDTTHFSITGNVVQGVISGDGINLGGFAEPEHGTITGNLIFDSGGSNNNAGIRIDASSITVTGNHVDQHHRQGTHGIRVGPSSRACCLIGNHALNADVTGITVAGSGCILAGNQASGRQSDYALTGRPVTNLGNINAEGAPAGQTTVMPTAVGRFAPGEPAPTVAGGNVFITAAGTQSILTNLADGVEGQQVTVLVDGPATIRAGAFVLRGGEDLLANTNDVIAFLHIGGRWYETSRSLG